MCKRLQSRLTIIYYLAYCQLPAKFRVSRLCLQNQINPQNPIQCGVPTLSLVQIPIVKSAQLPSQGTLLLTFATSPTSFSHQTIPWSVRMCEFQLLVTLQRDLVANMLSLQNLYILRIFYRYSRRSSINGRFPKKFISSLLAELDFLPFFAGLYRTQ